MADYRHRRREIYRPLKQEGVFTWDWMYDREYALASLYPVSRREQAELQHAAEELGKIFGKTLALVQRGDGVLLQELGIPLPAVAAVRAPFLPNVATVIGRFDFTRTAEGWKMLEFNSDTPGGVVEAFYVNERVCSYYGEENPNRGMEEQLTAAFRRAVAYYRAGGYNTKHLFFSALDWHEEDAGTARYLLRCSGFEARFSALRDLRVYDDALYALETDGLQPVDVLYRLHPLGLMAGEQDTDGYPTGAHVLDLAVRKKVALINPPAALIAQSKGLQALVWNLHETGEFFTEAEHKVIACHMLPTYFENRFLHREFFVTKPVFGREGGAVTIYDRDGGVVARDQESFYWDQELIYQRYIDLEQVHVETMEGIYQGRLIWGVFLLNGKASAISARLGGQITDDLAYFLPLKYTAY
ncbi:MAG: glutathionylspermidine synthase family protein [Bacillota bacterium]